MQFLRFGSASVPVSSEFTSLRFNDFRFSGRMIIWSSSSSGSSSFSGSCSSSEIVESLSCSLESETSGASTSFVVCIVEVGFSPGSRVPIVSTQSLKKSSVRDLTEAETCSANSCA